MRFYTHQKGLPFQIRNDLFAGLKTVQTLIFRRCQITDLSVEGENIQGNEVVPLSHLIVIEIMCRSDFYATAAKLGINIAVGNDRNASF